MCLDIKGFERGVLDGDGYCPECGEWNGLYVFFALWGWDDDFSLCATCAQNITNELDEQDKQERILKARFGTTEPEPHQLHNFWEVI